MAAQQLMAKTSAQPTKATALVSVMQNFGEAIAWIWARSTDGSRYRTASDVGSLMYPI